MRQQCCFSVLSASVKEKVEGTEREGEGGERGGEWEVPDLDQQQGRAGAWS